MSGQCDCFLYGRRPERPANPLARAKEASAAAARKRTAVRLARERPPEARRPERRVRALAPASEGAIAEGRTAVFFFLKSITRSRGRMSERESTRNS
jgi:hypothetical protein